MNRHNTQERPVIIIEDNEDYLESLVEILKMEGIHVSVLLNSFEAAMKYIDSLTSTDAIFLVDGNLSENDSSNNDGKRIIRRLKEKDIISVGIDLNGTLPADFPVGKKAGGFIIAEQVKAILNGEEYIQ